MSKPTTQTLSLVLSQRLLRLKAVAMMWKVDGTACMQDLEGYWLASTPYMAGEDISIADLLVVMELTQLHMLNGALKVSPRVCTHSFMCDVCLVTACSAGTYPPSNSTAAWHWLCHSFVLAKRPSRLLCLL